MLTTQNIITAAQTVAKEFPITSMLLFGSYAENRNTENSDVDVLVEFAPDACITLLTVSNIKIRMEELLKTPVDIITYPIPKNSILEINKVVQIYAA